MKIAMPDEVKIALDILNQNGYKAYIVGGCVRDSLIGIDVKDFDIATNAEPQKVKEFFSELRVIETGIKHGTVTVNINSLPIEITTFRIDGEYINNRKPSNVKFVNSLMEDVSRRDFTVNAIAYNPNESIIDYFDGISDINKKIIRCVGNADIRFTEDALRILRALRFAATLGFEIEEKTRESIFKNSHLLNNISKERIAIEFIKLLCGNNAQAVIKEYINIIAVFIPQIPSECIFYNILKVKPIVHLRLAAFFYDTKINAKSAKEILINLKFDNNTIDKVYKLILNKKIEIVADKKHIKKNLNKLGEKIFLDILELNSYDDVLTLTNEILVNNECYSLKNLNITGDDLMKKGIPEGKRVAEILNLLLFEVIDEKIENKSEALINRAEQIINKGI